MRHSSRIVYGRAENKSRSQARSPLDRHPLASLRIRWASPINGTEMDKSVHASGLLLPFQRHLLSLLVPPADSTETGNALLILARGLGLRAIVDRKSVV